MPVSAHSANLTQNNSRLLIERFKDRIEGFNARRQSLSDLYSICDTLDIEIVQMPMRRLHGAAVEERSFRYIYINSLLLGALKVIAGFHELTHLIDQTMNVEVFRSTGNLWNLPKFERQAQIIGVVAWMPSDEIYDLSVEDIMRSFGVPRNIAQFRLGLGI